MSLTTIWLSPKTTTPEVSHFEWYVLGTSYEPLCLARTRHKLEKLTPNFLKPYNNQKKEYFILEYCQKCDHFRARFQIGIFVHYWEELQLIRLTCKCAINEA